MEKITIASKANKKVSCANCKRAINAGEQHTYKGKNGTDVYLCSDCKTQINEAFKKEAREVNLPKALLGGFVAAVLGCIAWFGIEVITGFQIGYVAVGLGYLIIRGILYGSGNRRNSQLQIIGVILALLAIVAANYFIGVHDLISYAGQHYPNAPQDRVLTVSLSAAATNFFQYAIDPIGLFIWGIALYIVYRGLQPAKI